MSTLFLIACGFQAIQHEGARLLYHLLFRVLLAFIGDSGDYSIVIPTIVLNDSMEIPIAVDILLIILIVVFLLLEILLLIVEVLRLILAKVDYI